MASQRGSRTCSKSHSDLLIVAEEVIHHKVYQNNIGYLKANAVSPHLCSTFHDILHRRGVQYTSVQSNLSESEKPKQDASCFGVTASRVLDTSEMDCL